MAKKAPKRKKPTRLVDTEAARIRDLKRLLRLASLHQTIVSARLLTIGNSIQALILRMDQLMTKIDNINALLAQIDTATNEVGAKVDTQISELAELRKQIAAGTPVTEAQLTAIETNLTAERDRLTAIAAKSEDPIPAPTPDPTPVPEV